MKVLINGQRYTKDTKEEKSSAKKSKKGKGGETLSAYKPQDPTAV